MRIAVCTVPGSPDDLRVWSGTPAHFLRTLRQLHDDVAAVGPLLGGSWRVLNAASNVTARVGRNRKWNWEVEPAVLRALTRDMDRRLARVGADAVVCLGWFPLGSRAGIPVVHWTDATIAQRLETAPHWSGLSRRTERRALDVEARAFAELDLVLLASRNGLDDARDRYPGARTVLAPFGANIDDPGPVEHGRTTPLRLLTVGVKWHRKGIDTAVLTADALRRDGVDAHLDVVGVLPPDASWRRPHVTYHGFLAKGDPEQAQQLDRLYRAADVFLFPTRNEPYGIVLAEAAAYALPVVAARVGGVPDIVVHDQTGLLLDPAACPDDYAAAVGTATDPDTYGRMSRSARHEFETRLSWDSCAHTVLEQVRRLPRR